MKAEDLFQSWERAQYLGAVVGECNAMIVDENQFIKFIKVTIPPPKTIQIAFIPRVIERVNESKVVPPSTGPSIHKLEVHLRHQNYQGWVVYG